MRVVLKYKQESHPEGWPNVVKSSLTTAVAEKKHQTSTLVQRIGDA